ncbi:3-mercaptopyruvate sulfurtransferase-like [Babylonia areolata]|uniref:3-mercaptopyruvate sulfurtransferase-like n=1 Tax=Babylonia areolata TaxID=304850 RepID=UPI003FD3C4D4
MENAGAVVSVEWLADKLASSPKNVRILDGSWHLPYMNRKAKEEYASEHIPGALFFDINECADHEATNLTCMLPKAANFEAYVGKLGINNETQVIVYDNNDQLPLFSAQRVWWTFRVFGHENVFVMEGGLRKWKKLNKELSSTVPQVAEEQFTARYNPRLVKSFEEIEANQFKEKMFTLVDARPANHFEGKAPNPRPDIKSGCIPGSLNLPLTDLMDIGQQTLKSKEELLKIFKQLPVDLSGPVVGTCGSGISACMVALAAYECGNKDVAVYDGAWTEWYQRAKPDQMKNVPAD